MFNRDYYQVVNKCLQFKNKVLFCQALWPIWEICRKRKTHSRNGIDLMRLWLLLSIAKFNRKSMCLNFKKNQLSSRYIFESILLMWLWTNGLNHHLFPCSLSFNSIVNTESKRRKNKYDWHWIELIGCVRISA